MDSQATVSGSRLFRIKVLIFFLLYFLIALANQFSCFDVECGINDVFVYRSQNIQLNLLHSAAMAQHGMSVKERVVALVEAGNLSASEAGRRYGIPKSTATRWIKQYRDFGDVSRRVGTGSWRVSTREQDENVVLQARLTPFKNSEQLRRDAHFPGSSKTVRRRLNEAGLKSRRAAKKQQLSDEHKLYRLAFAMDKIHFDWSDVIFSDECVFSSANDGPVRVFRPFGTRHDPDYVAGVYNTGRVSVACWGWMSSLGLGMLHRIEQGPDGRNLTGGQYVHILENIMVPSVRELYPDGIIKFQQDQSPVHKSQLVQNWFSSQTEVELIDWPPCGADLNPIENVWAEIKRTMSENWPDPPPRTKEALWDLISDAWDEVASCKTLTKILVKSMRRRLTQVIDNEGSWSSY